MDSTNLATTIPMLTRFDGENGVEILINTGTGESFCSVGGYARMSGKAKSTIRERLITGRENHQTENRTASSKGFEPVDNGEGSASETHRFEQPETAEVLTSTGVKTVRLITEDCIVAWLPKDNPAAASTLLKLGVRMALHSMAGFSLQSTATAPPVAAEPSELDSIRAKAAIAIDVASTPGAADVFFALLNGTSPQTKAPNRTAATAKPDRDALVKQRILELSKKKGPINAGEARRGISKTVKINAAQIRTLFHQLAADGFGHTSGDDGKTLFTAAA
jgi:hypothetical protein